MTTRAKEIRELGNTGYLEVDANGNVGIGTDNPQAKFDVNGDSTFGGIASFTGSYIELSSSNTDPSTTTIGSLFFDTTNDSLKNYTTNGWLKVSIQPPKITNVSGVINEDTDSTLTITGDNFETGDIVVISGNAVTGDRQLTTTYVNKTTLTANTGASSANYTGGATFDASVLGVTGLQSTVLVNAGTVDRDPVWQTGAGNIADISDTSSGTHSTLSATDPDGTSVTYAIASGNLPGGLSLDGSTGVISGNPADVSGDTTSTFTVNALSNGQSESRSFNIIVRKTFDGSTSSRAAPSAVYLRDNIGISSNGTYWINVNSTPTQIYCNFTHAGGGWMSFAAATADRWFDGNSGTTTWSTPISYSYGTYDASGTVGHYWRDFSQQSVSDVMFLTGDSTYYLHLLLSNIYLSPNGSSHQVSVQGSNFPASGYAADTTATVMHRSPQPEDPWINAGNSHGNGGNGTGTDFMVWGETGYSGHSDIRQNYGGIVAFVR